jgi:hypothetical protein
MVRRRQRWSFRQARGRCWQRPVVWPCSICGSTIVQYGTRIQGGGSKATESGPLCAWNHRGCIRRSRSGSPSEIRPSQRGGIRHWCYYRNDRDGIEGWTLPVRATVATGVLEWPSHDRRICHETGPSARGWTMALSRYQSPVEDRLLRFLIVCNGFCGISKVKYLLQIQSSP